ncbi:MAG: hypothetical protein KDB23_15790 [Planctomycetales bacterium]|nr:hypothetical protein [Planctomycetales bacterium]
MFWPSEFTNSSHPLEQRGNIELNLDHVVTRQPLSRVAFKGGLVVIMYLIGLGIIVPCLPLPTPIAVLVASVILYFYCAASHYIRPRPNFDNMGWGAGLFNDPTQFNDNINRGLWNLSCLLGPGRFMSSASLEVLVSIRLLPERTDEQVAAYQQAAANDEWNERATKILERIEEIDAGRPSGRTQLASMKYFESMDTDEASAEEQHA